MGTPALGVMFCTVRTLALALAFATLRALAPAPPPLGTVTPVPIFATRTHAPASVTVRTLALVLSFATLSILTQTQLNFLALSLVCLAVRTVASAPTCATIGTSALTPT